MNRLTLSVRTPQEGARRQLVVDDFPCLIGRGLDTDLPLPYPSISGHHLRLSIDGEGCFLLTDLGSTNGTHLDDQSLPPHQAHRLPLPATLRLGHITIDVAPAAPELSGFTMAQSSTELRAIVDEVARQSSDADTHPFFEILSGPGSGQRLQVVPDGRDLVIGTTHAADLVLRLNGLPDQLATLSWRDGRCWIQAASDELIMGDEALKGHRQLRSGDRFTVGVAEIVFFDPLEDELDLLAPADQCSGPSDTEEMTDRHIQRRPQTTSVTDNDPDPDASYGDADDDADGSADTDLNDSEDSADQSLPKSNEPHRQSGLGLVERLLLTMAVVFLFATAALITMVLL